MSANSKTVEMFLTALQNGEYDAPAPKTKVHAAALYTSLHIVYVCFLGWVMCTQVKPPVAVRGGAVKAELSDTEGLGFKLEERQKDILQLKTALKMKVCDTYYLPPLQLHTDRPLSSPHLLFPSSFVSPPPPAGGGVE